jgi:hypothetical protein
MIGGGGGGGEGEGGEGEGGEGEERLSSQQGMALNAGGLTEG